MPGPTTGVSVASSPDPAVVFTITHWTVIVSPIRLASADAYVPRTNAKAPAICLAVIVRPPVEGKSSGTKFLRTEDIGVEQMTWRERRAALSCWTRREHE